MKFFRAFIMASFVSLVLSSCDRAPGNISEQLVQPTVDVGRIQTNAASDIFATMTASVPTITPTLANPDLLYFDDFSSITSGWPISDDPVGTRRYYDEQYVIKVKDDTKIYIAGIDNFDFNDGVIKVDVRLISGDKMNSSAHIFFRHVDVNNFYVLEINDMGYFGVTKCVDGEYSHLGYMMQSAALNKSGEVNSIAIAVHKNNIEVYFNDEYVSSYVDNSFQMGRVAIGVSTQRDSSDQPEFAFDNLGVYKYDVTNPYTPIKP